MASTTISTNESHILQRNSFASPSFNQSSTKKKASGGISDQELFTKGKVNFSGSTLTSQSDIQQKIMQDQNYIQIL
jgi:hypothetical protein